MVHDVNKGDKTRGTLSGVTGFICRSVDVYFDLRGPALGTQLHETTCSQVSRLTNTVKKHAIQDGMVSLTFLDTNNVKDASGSMITLH